MLIQPPRAEHCIAPVDLDRLEQTGHYIAQIKMNGQYSVIEKKTDGSEGEILILNRHGKPHKNWTLEGETKKVFQRLPKGIYCAELLHSKVGGIRDTHYFHDMLSYGHFDLIGKSYLDRYYLLENILHQVSLFKCPDVVNGCTIFTKNIWLTRNFNKGFKDIFLGLNKPEEEGIVLKDRRTKLTIKNDTGWSFKCRKSHKNFQF